MFKQEQNHSTVVPTYCQALLKAMKIFLMAPFFQNG